MGILLGLAVVAVGASRLYLVLTFDARTGRSAAPLIEQAVSELSRRNEAASSAIKSQIQDVKEELPRELAPVDGAKIETLIAQADRHMAQVSQLRAQFSVLEPLREQLAAKQLQLADELEQVANDVKLLSQSLMAQDQHIAALANHFKHAGAQVTAGTGAHRSSLDRIAMRLSHDRARLAAICS